MTLYTVQQYYKDPLLGKVRHVASIQGGRALPYRLALSLKRLEDLKNHPKGTFTKPEKVK